MLCQLLRDLLGRPSLILRNERCFQRLRIIERIIWSVTAAIVQTCVINLDGAYDALRWKLMHIDCADCYRIDMSDMVNLDEQLNAAK